MMSPRSTGRYGSSQLVNLFEGAYTCLLNSRKSPTSSVCSMLSEGIRSGCSTNVSRNSATTTVRNSEARASGSVGKCRRRCANCDSCPPRILLGVLFGAARTSRQRLSGLAGFHLEPDLNEKFFAVAGTTLALYPVQRRSCPLCLQPLLQRGFEVAQRRAGTQLLRQQLSSFAQHLAPREGPYRLESAVKKQRADHCLHGIREHRAFAPEAALVLAPAQPQMPAQANGLGHLRHMLPAYQLRTNAGQLALVPLRMQPEQSLCHHEP